MSEVSQTASSAAKLAAMKAAQINAKLAAKGIPIQHHHPPPTFPKQPPPVQMKTKPEILYAEIMINDIENRGHILKSSTQENICQLTGSNIMTRGRYIGPQDRHKLCGEKPLFLHISARHRDGLDRAVHCVLTTMKQHTIPQGSRYNGVINNNLLKICERDLRDASAPFTEKVYCGVGHMVLPHDMKQRVLGPNNSYFQHIINTTKARLTLKGRQSGHLELETGQELFEPMFVQINHSTIEGLVEAKNLVDSLLYSVHEKIKAERNRPQFSTQYPVAQPGQATSPNFRRPLVPDDANTAPKIPNKRSRFDPPGDISDPPMMSPSSNSRIPQINGNKMYPPVQRGNHMLALNKQDSHTEHQQPDKTPRRSLNQPPGSSLMTRANNNINQFKIPEYKKPAPPKRRFQEEFKVPKKKKLDKDVFKMPPPPGPISAGNVAEWTKEVSEKKKTRGRARFDRTVVCDYSDSDED